MNYHILIAEAFPNGWRTQIQVRSTARPGLVGNVDTAYMNSTYGTRTTAIGGTARGVGEKWQLKPKVYQTWRTANNAGIE